MTTQELQSAQSELQAIDYLERRKGATSFKTVEFGHGMTPIWLRNPEAYSEGTHSYLGVEQWLRGYDSGAKELQKKVPNGLVGTIQHVAQSAVGEVLRSYDQKGAEIWYEGDYSAKAEVEDSSIDEVVASNLLTDPMVAHHHQRVTVALAEMHRIVSEQGVVVLRETITPDNTQYLEQSIVESGLEVADRVTRARDSQSWTALEQVYNGDISMRLPNNRSFYLLLTKADNVQG